MRIACILESMFEDSEFQKPYEAFEKAGHQVTVIGMEAGKALKGKSEGLTVKAERSFRDTKPGEYDALFIPGGVAPDKLRAHPEPVAFTKYFFDAGKPIMAICHGPQLFLTADTYKGRRMTAWKTVQGDLQKAGADVVDQPVVTDRNLVTSRQPSDIPAFIEASLALLKQPVGAGR